MDEYTLIIIAQFLIIIWSAVKITKMKEEVRKLKNVLNSEVKDGRVWI